MKKFDDNLLSDYMNGFWGYGSKKANYWFVGMEEGGGDSFEEVNQRINQWNNRGRNPLEDIYDYHMDIKVPKWFQANAPIQPTWNRLIRVLLSTKGEIPDIEVVREYQINKLGRANGEVCMLELLPLPSPTINHWMYGMYSDLSVLNRREKYTQNIGNNRAIKITKLIQKHQPKFVMFYGVGYMDWWRKISNAQFTVKMLHNKKAYFGKLGNTPIAVSQHPVATGVSLDYFHDIGQILKARNL